MSNVADELRKELVQEINAEPGSREYLEAKHGQVWDTTQMQEDFEAIGFAAPYVVVRRRSDGQMGSLTFQARPRFYFSFEADS